jgi:excisionase family DNA binding protein
VGGEEKLMKPKEFFTISEAAKILGVSAETLRRWGRSKKIAVTRNAEGYRVFSQEDLDSIKRLFNSDWNEPSLLKSALNLNFRIVVLLLILISSLILAYHSVSSYSPIPNQAVLGVQEVALSIKDKIGQAILWFLPDYIKDPKRYVQITNEDTNLSIPSSLFLESLTVEGRIEGGSILTTGTINTNTLTGTRLIFSGDAPSIYPSTANSKISLNAAGSGAINIGDGSTGDIYLGGGSGSTGCTLTNSNGTFNCSGNITTGGDLIVNGGDIFTDLTTLNLNVANTGTINFKDGTNTLVSITDTGTTGDLNVTGVYKVGGTAGVTSASCGASQFLGGLKVTGGIVTSSGDCTTASSSWSGLSDPTANLSLSMAAYTTTFTWNSSTGSSNLFKLIDSASNSGTGYILDIETASSSNAKPFKVVARGNTIIDTTATGGITLGNTTAAQDVQFFSSSNKITSGGNLTIAGSLTTSGNILPNASPTIGASSQTATTTVSGFGSRLRYINMAMGHDGFPIIGFQAVTEGDLYIVKCTNSTCSTYTSTNLDSSFGTAEADIDIEILPDGTPLIAYGVSDATFDLFVRKCSNTSCTSAASPVTVDSTGNVGGEGLDMVIGADGLPFIAYRDTTNTNLKAVKCGNTDCSSGNTITTIDSGTGTGNSGGVISTALGVDGLPVVLSYEFVSGSTVQIYVRKCTNITCSTSTRSDIESGIYAGYGANITVGKDGLPFLTYQEYSTFDLRTVKCGNVYCSSGNTATTVETTNNVGLMPNDGVKIGNDGLPVIAHIDDTNKDLRVTKCGNPSCSSGPTGTSVDTAQTANGFPALEIPSDGLPIIAYEDLSTIGLRVVKCALPSCSQTSGGSYSSGSSIGSSGAFFNNVYAAQYWGRQFQIANFDLAEEYEVNDFSIEAGDVVSLIPGSTTLVGKATRAYDPTLIGIVSTNPAITLSDWSTQDRENQRPVALKGRVPVKVTNESGNIKKGDFLTSATKAGYAMKSMQKGIVLGTALSSLECSSYCEGKVDIFVNLHYNDPDVYLAESGELVVNNEEEIASSSVSTPVEQASSASAEASTPTPTPSVSLLSRLENLEKLLLSSSTSATTTTFDDLTVLKKLLVGDLGIIGKITSGLLSINGLDSNETTQFASINTISGDLYLQNQGLGGINFLNGKVTIDQNGLLRAQAVTTSTYGVRVENESSATFGKVTLPAGQTSIVINTSSVASDSLILLTPETLINFPLNTTEKIAGKSFKVEVFQSVDKDVRFSWWIVNRN